MRECTDLLPNHEELKCVTCVTRRGLWRMHDVRGYIMMADDDAWKYIVLSAMVREWKNTI